MPGVSGVGISFGADRIYDVLDQLNLYPQSATQSTQLLFVTFGETEQQWCLPVVAKMRAAGISTELYPESAKMKKQMSYANGRNIPFVAVVGENEVNSGCVALKNMATGEQQMLTPDEVVNYLKSK
jgi:histidyl-tRNA synthetase